jgi:hypothetical protein
MTEPITTETETRAVPAADLAPGMTVVDPVDGPLIVAEVSPDGDAIVVAYEGIPEPTRYRPGQILDVEATPEPADTRAMPNGTERPGEHWNARLIRESAEQASRIEADDDAEATRTGGTFVGKYLAPEPDGARLIRQAKESADQTMAAHAPLAGFYLTRAERATAAHTMRDLRAAGWEPDTVTPLAAGTEVTACHPSGRELTATLTGSGLHRLVLDGVTVDQMAGAVRGAGLTAEPKQVAEPVEPLTSRAFDLRAAVLTAVIAYAGATQDYGEASVNGTNVDERVRLLDQTVSRYAEVLRLTRELAALDAQAVTR